MTGSISAPIRFAIYSGAVCAFIWATAAANAADLPSRVDPNPPSPAVQIDSGWKFSFAMYAWASGMKGTTATLPPLPAVNVDVGFDKVLKHLNGAFMGAAELRNGRFLIATDLLYASLSASTNPTTPLFNLVKLQTSSLIGTLVPGYRLVDDPRYSFDVLAGVRGYSVATKVTTGSPLAILNLVGKHTESWVEPIVGVKGRVNLTDKFYFASWGFIGGFGAGSKISWDVFGGFGYAFSDRYSAVLGYRALSVDYSRNNFIYNIVQKGPVAALIVKF